MIRFLLLTLAFVTPTLATPPSTTPKLVVLIVVDQMRGDYLDRFADDFRGGYKRLREGGIVYTNADLNYASTETGPGHATFSTGAYPKTNGILGNEWFDVATGQTVYCVADSSALPVEGLGGWSSPRNLLATAIGDWLKQQSPSSKVISVSVKDRAAVLMGGKQPDAVFWYDDATGAMVTSSYYARSLPEYVRTFNRSAWIEQHVPDAWVKLLPDSVYNRFGPDEFEGEGKWKGSAAFPHHLSPQKRTTELKTSPYGDLLLLAFAREIVKAERLGTRSSPDLLAIGLSCSDYVGHFYGPNSHEIHDHFLRVDQALGEFFDVLDTELGADQYLVVLSSDHGVCPLPEYSSRVDGRTAQRISLRSTFQPALDRSLQALARRFNTREPLLQHNAFLNYRAATDAGLDSVAFEQYIKEGLLQVDGVVDVFFRRELLNPTTAERPFLRQFSNSYHNARGEDFQILFQPYSLVTTRTTGTTHGTPHRYDTHVPVVFWGAHLKSKRIEDPISTVDIAPTLAKVLGIDYPSSVDGKPLSQIIPPTDAPLKSRPE